MSPLRSSSLAFLLAPILSTLCAFATSEYRGQVTFHGVPIPGAIVTARHGEKAVVTITDSAGTYVFPELPEGAWAITVEMLGFAPVQGDRATTAWELKMLPLEEMHSEIAHNRQTTSTTPATLAAATSAAGLVAPLQDEPTEAFANLSPEELNQRAAEGLWIDGGIVKNRPSSPLTHPVGDSNMGVIGQPLYYLGVGIFPRLSSLNARAFSLTGQNTPKPIYNNFTGSFNFGGPVIPNRNQATFFVGYQRTDITNATTAAGRMPTLGERNGHFSQAVIPLRLVIIDPLTGLPFAGNVIPQSRISQQAQSLLPLFPLPNSDASAPYNYQIPIVDATHQDALEMRLTEWLNTRNQLFGNFGFQSTRGGSTSLFNFLDTTRGFNVNTGIYWTTRPSRRFSATLGYQFNRLSTRTTPYFANRVNVSGLAGINGNNQEAVNWGPPSLTFSKGTSSFSDAQYLFNRNETSTIAYTAFWNRGRHNITFGGDVRRRQLNSLSQQDARGTFTFTGMATGSDLADFLLGIPDTSSLAFGNADKYLRQTLNSAFLADDWRISDGFTINAGVRWEYESPISELHGRLVNLHVEPNFSAVAPMVGNNLVQPDRGGMMPRASLAWHPILASSLILRAGYGIYRNTNVYQPIAIQMAQQSPLSKSLSIENTPSNPLTLANGFLAGQGITPNTFAIDPSFRVGYVQTWSLSVQHDLPAALQITAMYMGTKGSRLPQEFLPNTFPSGALDPAGYVYMTANGGSVRQAGQVQLRRRLETGLTATAQYTYSKAIDDSPLMAGGQVVTASTGGTAIAQNWLDLRAERSPSSFDQRHRLTLQGQYSTGVGLRGGALLRGWKSAVLNQWTIESSFHLGSGLPETPVYFASVPGTGVTGNLRPDLTGASVDGAPAGLFLNPAAFRAPAPGHWGNAGRNSVTGPPQFGLDASLGRTFRCGRCTVDFRMEVTNILNHVTFKSWNTVVNNAQFGLPVGVNTMRTLQPTLRIRF